MIGASVRIIPLIAALALVAQWLLWPGPWPARLSQAAVFIGLCGVIAWLHRGLRQAEEFGVRERALAETAERRSAFLARAGALLSSSLDVRATVQSVVQLTIPEIADRCLVSLQGEDGSLEHVAVAHVDPSKMDAMWEVVRSTPFPKDAPYGPPSVVRTGKEELVSEITDSMIVAFAADAAHAAQLKSFGLRSYMCLPIQARGETLGALMLLSVESGRRYTGADLGLGVELARQVGLALDNARLYEEAKETIKSREEFLAMASHELRNPLNALALHVRAFLNSAQRNSTVGLSLPRIVDRLRKIDRQIHRMTRLISDFLDVSQIVAGRLAVNPEPSDLCAVANEVVARFREELTDVASPISIRADGVVEGLWDRTRLDEVLTNLLSNAIKYGEGLPVEITILCSEETAWFTVIDQGMGIAPEAQARIFERFERAVPGRRYEGSGLGLWIVRNILDAMGGSIRVSSAPGAGTTFTVELPRNLAGRGGARTEATEA